MSKAILALYILITSLGLIVLKLGTESGLPISFSNSKVQFNFNLLAITGIILYATSFVLYVYLISKNDLGYIIPLTAAFIYVIVFIASAIVFNEVFTVTKIAGILLIITGLIFLNLKS